jgi:hypothetical protein
LVLTTANEPGLHRLEWMFLRPKIIMLSVLVDAMDVTLVDHPVWMAMV